MKKILLQVIIIILAIYITYTTNTNNYNNLKISNIKIINQKDIKEKPVGKIIIKKINLTENLYKINSIENNIEKHISILKESITPEKENSIMILAAHSGTGKIAYFNNLDKLETNDTVELIYNNRKYIYIVKNIWEEKKNGYINIDREKNKQLILTTCSPTKMKYQLIVNCIKKET